MLLNWVADRLSCLFTIHALGLDRRETDLVFHPGTWGIDRQKAHLAFYPEARRLSKIKQVWQSSTGSVRPREGSNKYPSLLTSLGFMEPSWPYESWESERCRHGLMTPNSFISILGIPLTRSGPKTKLKLDFTAVFSGIKFNCLDLLFSGVN